MNTSLRAIALFSLLASQALLGQEARTLAPKGEQVAVVSHVKVVSDKVPDMSSLETWKKNYIKEGMTDEQKAMAVWKTVRTYQHQEAPPNEFLQAEDAVMDAIKLFNVYGYSLCSVASCEVECLAR